MIRCGRLLRLKSGETLPVYVAPVAYWSSDLLAWIETENRFFLATGLLKSYGGFCEAIEPHVHPFVECVS